MKVEVLRAKPNIYGTFQNLMLLGHTLSEQDKRDYSVEINFEQDCVILWVEVK